MAANLPALKRVSWTAPCRLVRPDGSAADMTVFEAVHAVSRDSAIYRFRIECPTGTFAFGYDDLLAILSHSHFHLARPLHGFEANTLLLEHAPATRIAEPLFSGNWEVACRHAAALPAARRAKAFVVSHDTVYPPAWLAAHGPARRTGLISRLLAR